MECEMVDDGCLERTRDAQWFEQQPDSYLANEGHAEGERHSPQPRTLGCDGLVAWECWVWQAGICCLQ